MRSKKMKIKKKDYRKLNRTLGWLFAIIIIILVFVFIIGLIPSKDKSDLETYNVNNTTKEYMRINNRVVYLTNLEELMLNYEDKRISLKDYIASHDNDLDKVMTDLASYLKVKTALKDGGTIIYEVDDKNIFNEDITVIKCHTEDGNEDIYFGKNMNTTNAFKNGACGKNYFEDVSFTRIYTLSNIKDLGFKEAEVYNSETKKTEMKKSHYYELTIKDQDQTLKIERVMDDESVKALIKGEKYTFYFQNKYGELIKDEMEDIFNKCTLEKIVLLED